MERGTATAHFSKACNFPGAAGLPFPPVSLLSPLQLSLPSVPLSPSLSFPSASFRVPFSLQVCSPFRCAFQKHNWSIHFTTRFPSL